MTRPCTAPMNSTGASVASRSAGSSPAALACAEEQCQALAVRRDHRAHFGTYRRVARVLQLVEHDAGNAGVGRDERHMREERTLDLAQRRIGLRHRRVEHRAERFAHPGKDGEPDRLLVGEVPEERALRDADPVGDRLGRDRIRAALAGQREHGGDDLALPLVGLQAVAGRSSGSGRGVHGILIVA